VPKPPNNGGKCAVIQYPGVAKSVSSIAHKPDPSRTSPIRRRARSSKASEVRQALFAVGDKPLPPFVGLGVQVESVKNEVLDADDVIRIGVE
jgi:hypothetical protein